MSHLLCVANYATDREKKKLADGRVKFASLRDDRIATRKKKERDQKALKKEKVRAKGRGRAPGKK